LDEGIDRDIATLELDDVEKSLLQMHRNYTKAFQRKAAETIDKQTAGTFDIAEFEGDLGFIASAPLDRAVLATVTLADTLLEAMYKRDARPRLQMSQMLGPLGPLGDFNRRLKVAALSEFIDEDDLTFFDELRKLRNRIAHGKRPSSPTAQQIRQVVSDDPVWLSALAERGSVSSDIDLGSEAILRASMLLQVAKLAWGTLLRPRAMKAGVPLGIMIEERPALFLEISRVGTRAAINVLKAADQRQDN